MTYTKLLANLKSIKFNEPKLNLQTRIKNGAERWRLEASMSRVLRMSIFKDPVYHVKRPNMDIIESKLYNHIFIFSK